MNAVVRKIKANTKKQQPLMAVRGKGYNSLKMTKPALTKRTKTGRNARQATANYLKFQRPR